MKITNAVTVLSGDHAGLIGVIVDISDAHGLTYGVVFPNFNGSAGRRYDLNVVWFEPEELEFKEVK